MTLWSEAMISVGCGECMSRFKSIALSCHCRQSYSARMVDFVTWFPSARQPWEQSNMHNFDRGLDFISWMSTNLGISENLAKAKKNVRQANRVLQASYREAEKTQWTKEARWNFKTKLVIATELLLNSLPPWFAFYGNKMYISIAYLVPGKVSRLN